MSDYEKLDKNELTIVGGQPRRRKRSVNKIQVPVGVEKILFHASRDAAFKKDLLADRGRAIARSGIQLRPSEAEMLKVISDEMLLSMIAGVVPENPKRRKFMTLVAAAATSLAAGTASVSCDPPDDSLDGGIGPIIEEDAGDDSDEDSDTVETDNSDLVPKGVDPDTDIDGNID